MEEIFHQSPNVILTEVGDGHGVLLHLETKFYYTLNTTGVVLWNALAEGATRGAIAAVLAREFRVDAVTAGKDAEGILTELVHEGLARRSDVGG